MTGKKDKVVVAMSGGVDSSVAATLLVEQGYDVVGLFMRIGADMPDDPCKPDRHHGCCSAADAADARFVAGKLGIPFYALNFEKDFDRIVDYFADEYKKGRTPNPCVLCNDQLKFGKLVKCADSINARFVATGHYARIVRDDAGSPRLVRSGDPDKDQTYVLFGLSREMLDRAIFPLGSLTKEQVRAEARRLGLPVHDKPDSVDICFVPDGDYARVVRERRPEAFVPGSVVDQQGNEVGQHDGVANFTIGQRRGLGIAMGSAIYVVRLNADTATVTVGTKADLLETTLVARDVNWLMDPPAGPMRVAAKIRYAHPAAGATITPLDDQSVRVTFDSPQSAITPGQAVVWYDGDCVVGGGWIDRVPDE